MNVVCKVDLTIFILIQVFLDYLMKTIRRRCEKILQLLEIHEIHQSQLKKFLLIIIRIAKLFEDGMFNVQT